MDNKQKSVNIKSSLIEMTDLFLEIKENNPKIEYISIGEKSVVISMGECGNYVIATNQISANEILEKMFPESK